MAQGPHHGLSAERFNTAGPGLLLLILQCQCRHPRGCRHWALTVELGRINATLCELEESFIAAADRAAATLMAEGCASFVATYYRQRYTRAIGSTVTRVEPPGRR